MTEKPDRYRIVVADTSEVKTAAILRYLHELTFGESAPQPELTCGRWLLVKSGNSAVAFAGVANADRYDNFGYFCRVGVTSGHRGHALQLRLMLALEEQARIIGWRGLVSDTTSQNTHSANNFIKAGWEIFWPDKPWSFPEAIYWRKMIGKALA